jgi:hypothetical protein
MRTPVPFRGPAAAAIRQQFARGRAAYVAIPADVGLTPGEAKGVPFHPGHEIDLDLAGELVPVTVARVAIEATPPAEYAALADLPPMAGGFAWVLAVHAEAAVGAPAAA